MTTPDTDADSGARPAGFVQGINRLLTYFAGMAVAESQRAEDEWHTGGYSITAIVLSAAPVEAHVGEYLALRPNREFFAEEIEAWQKSLPRPAEIVKTVIKKRAGEDVGSMAWYDRLRCLFELRNHAIHHYPEYREVGTFPKKLGECVRKHAITPVADEDADWTSRLLVGTVAAQALSIALEAIAGFDEAIVGESGRAV